MPGSKCNGVKGPANNHGKRKDMGSLMRIERDRLVSLIEFSQQSARAPLANYLTMPKMWREYFVAVRGEVWRKD